MTDPWNQRAQYRRVRSAAPCAALTLALFSCGSDAEQRPPTETTAAPHLDPALPGREAEPGVDPALVPPLLAPTTGESGEGNPNPASVDAFVDDSGAVTVPLSVQDSCAATAVEAESVERVVEVPVEEQVVVPSVFYLMLDSSGSMVTETLTLDGLVEAVLDLFGLGSRPPMLSKWDYALDGLNSFVNDPASAGVQLALGYFPDGGACDGAGYDVPAVALGAVPEGAGAIQASLAAREPAGNTPLEGALRGATGFCRAFNSEHPDASCVAVLITDGVADQCDARSAADLAAIAASARESGVLTFAAGMQGADGAVLDAIGEAGGGDCSPEAPGFACDLTANRQAFVNSLNSIRDRTRTQTRIERHVEREVQVLPCEWEIPAPPAGAAFDPGRLNVQLSLSGAAAASLAGVPGAADCGEAGGWFYDDAGAPSRVQACPATCATLQAQGEARVELLFGCKTILR